jgi:hypothetical protein
MALKYKYTTKQEIPAQQQSFYVERDGAFVLDADGIVDKAKADEMRAHNMELRKQIEERDARFDGSLRTATEELERVKAEKERLELQAQGHKPEEIDQRVTERLKSLKAAWEKQQAAVAHERDALLARLSAIQIDQGVITAATRRGLRPTAIPDITARARLAFKLVNGAPQAFEADGKSVRYGKDNLTPMTLEEWVDAQVSDAPHLFEANAGGGAAGNGGGAAGASVRAVKNPFRRDSWNLTEQMKIQKTDPALAARLKASA